MPWRSISFLTPQYSHILLLRNKGAEQLLHLAIDEPAVIYYKSGNGGGVVLKSFASSGADSAAIQLAIPCFQTSDSLVNVLDLIMFKIVVSS